MMMSRIMSKAMMCGRDRAAGCAPWAGGAPAGACGVARAFGLGATGAVAGIGATET
jgi:hypothetical protein